MCDIECYILNYLHMYSCFSLHIHIILYFYCDFIDCVIYLICKVYMHLIYRIYGAWRRGKRPSVQARGTMFEPYRGCATADLFHFDAYIEGPAWGPRMSLIKTRTQPFWALVRLLSCFSMDLQYLSCARGGVGIFHPP